MFDSPLLLGRLSFPTAYQSWKLLPRDSFCSKYRKIAQKQGSTNTTSHGTKAIRVTSWPTGTIASPRYFGSGQAGLGTLLCTYHTMTHHTMARHRMTQQPHSVPTIQWPNYHIVHPSPQNDKAYSAPQHGIPNTANLPCSFIQRKFLKLTLLYLYDKYLLTGSDSRTLRCKQSLLDLWRDSFHRDAKVSSVNNNILSSTATTAKAVAQKL